MILIDTSAWIEYDRATGSDVHLRVRELVRSQAEIVSTEPVLMESLAGAQSDSSAVAIKEIHGSFGWIAADASTDFEGAATIYRVCRSAGITPPGLVDCLIAAIAMRSGAYVLAHDRDFERIASVVPLRLDSYN
jgi:hypothetical protein